MIKIYFDENLRAESVISETFWAFADSDKEEYRLFFQQKNNLLEKSSIDECDYIFLPYKWTSKTITTTNNNNLSKKVIAFFNDDFEENLEIPQNNFILFRTSTNKLLIKNNERIMPAFCEFISFIEPKNNKIISFCGNTDSFRKTVFQEINKNKQLDTNFIFRKGFWAPEISDKKIARQQFIENIQNSLFVLCMRGAGNFSYRLYETLACGRIPIIINSNLVLPLEKHLSWKDFSIIIEKDEIRFLDIIIEEFLENKNIIQLCKNNQKIWDEYFSPHGFIKNIKLHIEGE